jgi:hypothetical protein
MSELIENGGLAPKDLLKHLILQLKEGDAVVRTYFRR